MSANGPRIRSPCLQSGSLIRHPSKSLRRMLKKSASGVLASLRGSTYQSVRLFACSKRYWALKGHGPLTISQAFTSVPRLIRRGVNLAPVRKHDARASSRRAP
jgi:hypothetical protein